MLTVHDSRAYNIPVHLRCTKNDLLNPSCKMLRELANCLWRLSDVLSPGCKMLRELTNCLWRLSDVLSPGCKMLRELTNCLWKFSGMLSAQRTNI